MQSVREGEAGTGRGRRIQWDGEKVSDSAAAAVRLLSGSIGAEFRIFIFSLACSPVSLGKTAPMKIKIRIKNLHREFRHNPFRMTEFMLEKLQLHFYSVDGV